MTELVSSQRNFAAATQPKSLNRNAGNPSASILAKGVTTLLAAGAGVMARSLNNSTANNLNTQCDTSFLQNANTMTPCQQEIRDCNSAAVLVLGRDCGETIPSAEQNNNTALDLRLRECTTLNEGSKSDLEAGCPSASPGSAPDARICEKLVEQNIATCIAAQGGNATTVDLCDAEPAELNCLFKEKCGEFENLPMSNLESIRTWCAAGDAESSETNSGSTVSENGIGPFLGASLEGGLELSFGAFGQIVELTGSGGVSVTPANQASSPPQTPTTESPSTSPTGILQLNASTPTAPDEFDSSMTKPAPGANAGEADKASSTNGEKVDDSTNAGSSPIKPRLLASAASMLLAATLAGG